MRRWDNDLKVGVMVVIGVILLGILLTMASDWSLGTPGEKLTLHFPHLQNLKKGAHTQLAGVAVGKVTDIRLDESGYGEVAVRIKPPFELREGLKAELQTLGIVGETIVMLTNGDPNAPPLDWSQPVVGTTAFVSDILPRLNETIDQLSAFLTSVERVGSDAQRDLQNVSEAAVQFMGDLSNKADALVETTDAAADELTEALTALEALESLPPLVQRAQSLLEQAEKSVAALSTGADETLKEASEALQASRGELESLAGDLRETLRSAQASLDQIDSAADSIESNVAQTTGGISTTLNAGMKRAFQTLARLEESAGEIQRFAQRLDRIAAETEAGKGSIGRLLTDDSLAKSAASAVKRIDDFTAAAEKLGKTDLSFLSGGAEIAYRDASQSLQNEAFLTIRPWESQGFTAAIGSRESNLIYSLTLEQKAGPFWGRLGVIDSSAGVGIDWEPHARTLLRVEALDVARSDSAEENGFQRPRIDAEIGYLLWKRGRLFIGGEDLAEDRRGIFFGVRAHY